MFLLQAPMKLIKSEREISRSLGGPMSEVQHRFLSLLGQLPARLTAEQAAWVLNCQPHDIPALVAARLLKPLGNPPANGIKFFCTAEIIEHSNDRSWLARCTITINQHWHKKNASKKDRPPQDSPEGSSSFRTLRAAA